MDIDVYRSLCENNNHEGSQVHHRNLGADDKIINNLANVHLIEKPALETAQSASSSIDDYSECFGIELADLYEEENEPALWKELAGVALDKYREKEGVELELAEDVTPSAMVFKGGVCVFHLYFKAKSNDHSSPVQIFAEVFRTKEGARHVSVCDIMDPSNPDLVRRCRYCVKKVLHPKGMEFFKFPSPEAYVRASSCNEDYSEHFGLELSSLLPGVALEKYNERQLFNFLRKFFGQREVIAMLASMTLWSRVKNNSA